MYPKRTWRTPYLNGYDLGLENIVHFYSYTRYKPLDMERCDDVFLYAIALLISLYILRNLPLDTNS